MWWILRNYVVRYDTKRERKKERQKKIVKFWLTDCWILLRSSHPSGATETKRLNMQCTFRHFTCPHRHRLWRDNQNMHTDDIKMQRQNKNTQNHLENTHEQTDQLFGSSFFCLQTKQSECWREKEGESDSQMFWLCVVYEMNEAQLKTMFWFADHENSSAVIPICELTLWCIQNMYTKFYQPGHTSLAVRWHGSLSFSLGGAGKHGRWTQNRAI